MPRQLDSNAVEYALDVKGKALIRLEADLLDKNKNLGAARSRQTSY